MSTEQTDMRGPRERIYDEHISPLMQQIITICKDAGIPIHARFVLDEDLRVTTHLSGPAPTAPEAREQWERFKADYEPIVDRYQTPSFVAMTISYGGGRG